MNNFREMTADEFTKILSFENKQGDRVYIDGNVRNEIIIRKNTLSELLYAISDAINDGFHPNSDISCFVFSDTEKYFCHKMKKD